MTIAPTAAPQATSLYTTNAPATTAKKEMDKEVFLTLLVAQLRNQDPTSPMDTNEMMAQSTQLASMEQLTGLADTSRESFALQMRIAASGLVGRQVSFTDADGVTRTGVASSVSFAAAVPTVTVGEHTVPLDAVSAIEVAAAATTGTTTDPSTDATGTTTDTTTDTTGSTA
ncbi:flagellar hook assembly protein FlgD [Cellulomonas sp. KRMCY2]|uniref:flagellar hook assembly protein FlgD n=1 Tax=Cellulomonas sp. KRMCY2 TaxID=1304865 RepID=UPI00045E8F40|nr:flagellar hook capping FlgD N-terminal domain-containing protein [Cellulomonas sp. KRMCY2]